MSAAGKLGLIGRAAGLAKDTAATALFISAAAHIGAVAWFLSDGQIDRSLSVAGGTTVIDVVLVEGPAEGATGEPGDNETPAAARPASTDAEKKEPERERDHARRPAVDGPGPAEPDVREREEETATAERAPVKDTIADRDVAATEAPVPDPVPVPPAKPPVPAQRTVANIRMQVMGSAPPERTDAATNANRTADSVQLASRPSSGGGTPAGTDGQSQAAAPRANNPAPSYPRSARRRGEEGKVVLRVEVLPDGRAGAVTIGRSSGFGSLDKAALDAVRRWRFQPAQRQGRPVAATVRVPVRFALNR